MFNAKIALLSLVLIIVTVLLLVLSPAACQRKFPGKETFVIGGVLPLTGDAATFGQNALRGAQLAVEVFNEGEQAASLTFEFKAEDSRGDAAEAANAVRKLIDVSGASMIVGDVTSAGTHAILPIASRKSIPVVSPAASDPALSGKSEFFCRLWPSDTYEAEVIGGYARQQGYHRIIAVYVNSDYGVGMMDAFTGVVGEGNIVTRIPVDRETLDYRPTLARIRLGESDALFLVLYPEDAKRVLQQLAEQRMSMPLLATATIEEPSIAPLPAATQIVFASPVPPEEDDPIRSEFVQRYRDRFGSDPGVLSDTGYDSAMLLMHARAASGPNGVAVIRYIKDLKDYPGVSGRMSFDSNGNVRKPYRLKTVRDGVFVWKEP